MSDQITYEGYRPERLPAVVAFWNRVFAERRNFFPVDESNFRDRVIEKKTAVERFQADGFIMAVSGDRVVGLVHAGRHSEEICKVLNPEWPGGERGFVALLVVDPDRRRKGVGTALWDRAGEYLRGTTEIILDGQCLNPFYGNSEGPFTPFWGTPEGISVEWNDDGSKKFFAQKGFEPRFRAAHLELDLSRAALQEVARLEADVKARGFRVEPVHDVYPVPGLTLEEATRGVAGTIYECLTAFEDQRVAGLLCNYPMAELGEGRHAIYEMNVHEDYRERGLGRALLALSIERMRAQGAERCDVLTLPELSEGALHLYESAGFTKCAEWAIY